MAIKTQELPRQGTLPFNRKSKGRQVRKLEKFTECEADFELSRFGYGFLNTTVRYPFFTVQCPNPKCARFFKVRNSKGTGQDKGIADRLVYSPKWWHPLLRATLWLSVELKGSHTRFSSDEQKELVEAGHSVLARDGETALAAARDVDRFFAYVERLEASAASLLDDLRAKSPEWKEKAQALASILREAGEKEAEIALSPSPG